MKLPFAEAQKIVGAAIALAALTVPAALVVNVVPLPAGMATIATALCGLVALGTTLLIAVQSVAIRRLQAPVVTILSLVLLVAASATAIGYVNFAKGQIQPVVDGTTVYYVKPLIQSEELRLEMTHWEDYEEAFGSQPERMSVLFEKDDDSAVALLFTLILLAQLLFVGGIVIAAWWLALRAPRSKAAPEASAPPA